jgi:hypothetical protein
MHDNVLVLILVGIVAVFKWLTKRDRRAKEKPPAALPNETKIVEPPPNDAEQLRRFLEAIGAPPGTAPPVRRAPARPAVRNRSRGEKWQQPLPPLTTVPPPEPVLVAMPPVSVITPPPPSFPSPIILAPSAVSAPFVRKAESALAPARSSLGEILRRPENVRQAVVLREVLGPPRGLRADDDLRSF